MEQRDAMPFFSLLLTIPRVARALNLGRTKVYELIEKENLPVQRFERAIPTGCATSFSSAVWCLNMSQNERQFGFFHGMRNEIYQNRPVKPLSFRHRDIRSVPFFGGLGGVAVVTSYINYCFLL